MPDPRRLRCPHPLVGLLLLLAMAAAACGGTSENGGTGSGTAADDLTPCPVEALDDAQGPVQVTLWHAYVGMTKKTLEKIADEYNSSQDKVKVTVEAQGTYEELLKKYEDALGDPATLPDLILTEDTTTQFMIDSGQVIPATSCVEADPDGKAVYEPFLPAVLAAYTVDDVQWPVAFSVSNPVLYFNEVHFQAAGLDPADPPETLEELRAAAEKIKAANIDGVGQPLVLKMDSWYVEHWLTGAGVPIVDKDNGRAGLATTSEYDNDTTAEIYEWIKGMVDDGLIKAVPNSSQVDEYLAVATQSSSMLIQTSTAITTINGIIEGTLNAEDLGVETDLDLSAIKLPDLPVGVGLAPGLEQAGGGQIGGSGWYLLDTGQDAEAAGAWDFIKFFNETPQQVAWTLEGSYLPASTDAAEAPALVEDFTTTRKGGWLATATESLGLLDPDFPGPVIGPYKEFRVAVRASLEEVALSGADTGPAIATASQKFQSALDAYAQEVGG